MRVSPKVLFIAFFSSLLTYCQRCEAHGFNLNRSDPTPTSSFSISPLRSSPEFRINCLMQFSNRLTRARLWLSVFNDPTCISTGGKPQTFVNSFLPYPRANYARRHTAVSFPPPRPSCTSVTSLDQVPGLPFLQDMMAFLCVPSRLFFF